MRALRHWSFWRVLLLSGGWFLFMSRGYGGVASVPVSWGVWWHVRKRRHRCSRGRIQRAPVGSAGRTANHAGRGLASRALVVG
jgi:hypothetical protein